MALGFSAHHACGETESPAEKPVLVEVDDTSCRIPVFLIGSTSVHLSISDLIFKDGELVGNYSIEVPIKTSKNESGSLRLPLKKSVSNYMEKGGRLVGDGYSHGEERLHRDIIAVVKPTQKGREGVLELTVDTGERVMEFSSNYRVVVPEDGDAVEGTVNYDDAPGAQASVK